MTELNQPLKVFLCHGSADKTAVLDLYKRLAADGVDAWLDVEKLLPGQHWQEEIPNAVRNSDVVLVCLSESSVNKEGYIQKEITFAIDKALEMPEGSIFLIPARLEECKVPHRLSQFQWVDLFHESGYDRLIKALRHRAEQKSVHPPGRKYLLSTGQIPKAALSNSSPERSKSPGEGTKTGSAEAGSMELQPKTLLPLGDSTYFVQKLVCTQNSGNMIIRSAHASDQVMQEDVGILHISFATNQGDVQGPLGRAYRRAQNMKQAADHSRHLAMVRKILPNERDLWVVSQWVRGLPWSQHYPLDGPLPGAEDMDLILGWAIDVCDGLAALHKLREVHGGLSEETIKIKSGRAVLIDPGFAGKPVAGKLLHAHFDPQPDIRALGEVLFRTLTHQSAGQEPAGNFNFLVPAALGALVSRLRDGQAGSALVLKREMIQLRNKARP